MKLGISSFAYTWAVGVPGFAQPAKPLTACGVVERAAGLGLRLVQFGDNIPLHRFSPAELDALAACAQAHGVTLEVGARGLMPDHLRAYLEVARRLGARLLRVVTDSAGFEPTEDEVVATIRALLPALREAGVTLGVENHDRFKVAALARIMARIGGENVGICLDTANSFAALEGPEVVVGTLAPWAVNLHLKDFVVLRAEHRMGFRIEGRPVGRGQLDAPWLLGALRAAGREVNAILEQWTPPDADLAATIAREAAWAEESIVYLRTLISE